MNLAPRDRVVEFDGRRRVIIEGVSPAVDEGRFPAKRVVGDTVLAEADIFADGHDLISAVIRHRHQSEKKATEVRMRPLLNDRWRAEFAVSELGFYSFTITAWIDHFLTWHRDLKKRVDAGVTGNDLDVQLQIGLGMIRDAAANANARDRKKLEAFISTLESNTDAQEKVEDMWSEDLLALTWRNAERKFSTTTEIEYPIEVDRPKAAFSTWYELFPRSAASKPGAHGTFADVEAQLPRI